jgi:hypothetical protein
MPDLGKVARAGARRMFKLADARTGIYSQKQGGTFSPTTDSFSGQITKNFAVKCVLSEEKVQNYGANSVIEQRAPLIVILGESVPDGFNPKADDTLELDGTVYVVVSFSKQKIGDVVISFIMTVKN